MIDNEFYDPSIHNGSVFTGQHLMSFEQSLRLQLVMELIRAGRIDDCLSLAHEAEQFVLNGMENKPVDVPAPSMSLWEMCEAIITAPDPDNIGPKNWALLKHNKASSFEILGVGDAVGTSFVIHAATIMPESKYDKVRELLMQFPPFKK